VVLSLLFEREDVRRVRLAGGVTTRSPGELLAGLPGVLSWDGLVLRTEYPEDRTLYLGGRGLVLLPSCSCCGNLVAWTDPELPPVLIYPAHSVSSTGEDAAPHLVALLGRTRADCLRTLLVPRTTTELAQRLGISLGAASKHAAVLRDSGLADSSRRGKTVLHNATPLGVALLTGRH
jgi:DNA-binding transcriptional ArsR family regulator